MESGNLSNQKPELWPVISPYGEGFLPVDNIHTIHYALYGNYEGKPAAAAATKMQDGSTLPDIIL
jgi:hypothetical protein